MTGVHVHRWPPHLHTRLDRALVLARDLAPDMFTGMFTNTPLHLVQYLRFAPALPIRFDAAVARGYPDTAAGFLRFASSDYTRYARFHARFMHPDAPVTPRVLIDAQMADQHPGPALLQVLQHIAPALAVDGAAMDLLARRAADITLPPLPAPQDFRHHDAALFAQLATLRLTRATVRAAFIRLLARTPDDTGTLVLQTLPNTPALTQTLSSAPEYHTRHPRRPTP